MLILDRTQRTWATFSGVVFALATGVYFWTSAQMPNGPSGGSLPGLIFGIIAALMMVYAGLLGARRRFPSAPLGNAKFWMRSHLWSGTLTVPFALYHAGFGLGGWLEFVLWGLFFAVILSGFWGLALQNFLPKMMLDNISRETFFEQIPHLCLQFTLQSDAAVAARCGQLNVEISQSTIPQIGPFLRSGFEEAKKEDAKKPPKDKLYPPKEDEEVQFQRYLTTVYRIKPDPIAQSAAQMVPPVDANTAVTLNAPEPADSPAVPAPTQKQLDEQQQLNELKSFYQEMVRPFLGPQRATRDWQEGIKRAILASRIRRTSAQREFEPVLAMFQDYCEQRQQFLLIQRYHAWLHGWLMIHIPATVALYVILVVHIFMALRVVPLGA